jgi:phage baseplate assembly protein W
MSQDFKLKQACPHRVKGEWLALEEDRQTLAPVKNPSSKKVRVQRDGLDIPKQGLYSDLEITTSQGQPFSVDESTEELTFSVNNGSEQTVTLPRGGAVSSDRIARRIENRAEKLEARATENGKIAIRVSPAVNRSQKSLFLKGGSAHSVLGLPDRRRYVNRQIVPGWALIDEEGPFGDPQRKIKFASPLRSSDGVFEVSYYTQQKDCRRCQGLGIEDDLRYNRSGDPIFAEDEQLLLQEVRKIVFTVQGSNIFFKWYGTSITNSIGTKISQGGDALKTQLTAEISKSLDRYRQLKMEQAKIQPVSNEEFLLKVRNLIVEQDSADPTVFRVQIDMINRQNQVKSVQRTITLGQSESTSNQTLSG